MLTSSSPSISSCLWCSLASLRVSATSVPSVLRLHSSTLPALDLGGKENEDKLEFSVLQEQPWMSSSYRWGQVWPNKHASTLAHTVRRVLLTSILASGVEDRGWVECWRLREATVECGRLQRLGMAGCCTIETLQVGMADIHRAARSGPPGLQLWALYRVGRLARSSPTC